ncbi:MAG: ATPase, T2SS/T4P/T4SS family [bacterium]
MNILDKLLMIMFQQNAESIFFIEELPPFIKFKDGKLQNLVDEKIEKEQIEELLKIFLTDRDRIELKKWGYWLGNYTTSNNLTFKGICFYQKNKLTIIFYPAVIESYNIEELELPSIFIEALNKNKGLIIISGPRKSGKTTIFNSSVEYILNNRYLTVATVEDFIEKEFSNSKGIVYQFLVGKDYADIKEVLNIIRRVKPDVVAIQEIVNYDYLSLALDLSLSGLLVICTLNADGIISTFEKIAGMAGDQKDNVFRYLSMVLEVLISGNLFYTTENNLKYVYDFYFNDVEFTKNIAKGDITEVYLKMVERRDKGFRVQEHTLKALVKKGLIKEEEALLKAARPNELKKLLNSPF